MRLIDGLAGMDLLKWRPPYAHVPGVNQRHAPNLFEPLKSCIDEEVRIEELRTSVTWLQGQAFLREGYYWESHEVLEAVWLKCNPNTVERMIVQSLIQLANAGLKKKMQRENAFRRLLKMAEDLFEESARRSEVNGLEFSHQDFMDLRKEVLRLKCEL